MNTVNPPRYPVIGHTRVLILCNFIADDWKADQYQWFQNGSKKLPTSNPLVTRGRKRKLITKDKLETNTSTSSIRFDKLYSTIRQGGKLSDEHISAACRLLLQQFPDSQGLYTPVLGQNLSFPPVNPFYY